MIFQMYPIDTFSTIRRRSSESVSSPISEFYDDLLRPYTLLFMILGSLAFVWRPLVPKHAVASVQHVGESSLIMILLIVSFVVGIRLIQAIYLAKRDYIGMDAGFSEILIFITVIIFLSGSIIALFQESNIVTISVYSFFCLIGIWNFLQLLTNKLPEGDDIYDFPLEKRIQIVNVVCFCSMLMLFLSAIATILIADKVTILTLIFVSANIPVTLFNIVHSHRLSNFSKFLIDNWATHPDRVVNHFRTVFPYEADDEPVRLAIEEAHAALRSNHKSIILQRANRGDVDRIAEYLFGEFGYVFDYLLVGVGRDVQREIVVSFLMSGFGLGAFGYLRFYRIFSEGEFVGFAKIDTARELPLYVLMGQVTGVVVMIQKIGIKETFGFLSRLKYLYRQQGRPDRREIRLSYLVIFDEFRSKGYGKAFVKLLADALIRSTTNGMKAGKITLFVRNHNLVGRSLFEKAGFLKANDRNPSAPQTDTSTSMPDGPSLMELVRRVD